MQPPRFPNESPEYRQARDQLVAAEAALREQVEAVAALRRRLPLGGEVNVLDLTPHGRGEAWYPSLSYED